MATISSTSWCRSLVSGAHLADVFEIVAPDAPDAANGISAGFADDGKSGLRRQGDDVGGCVHEAVSFLR